MELINYEDKKTLATLKETIAQGFTDTEFAMAIEFCKATGLNPFKKEIWLIKVGGRVQMMTGINGFHTTANRNAAYDGIESGLVGKDGSFLPATYPGSDFIGAWARVHRKDRKFPVEGVAMLSEYDKRQGTWNTMKRTMINKCAESIALRKAFPQELGGLYTAEEMPVEYSAEKPAPVAVRVVEEPRDAIPTWYNIPDPTHEQRLFLEKRGCQWDEASGTWACPMDLGKRLEAFKVAQPVKEERGEVEVDIPFDLKPADELPQETPLEKAKRRAAKMTAEAA
jgi:phage recombination protein Bet